VRDRYYDWKKKYKSSVWWVRDRYYERKKKSSSRLSGGWAINITTGKKKVQVVCLAGTQSLLRAEKRKVLVVYLAGARSLLRAEKKKFKSSVWRVCDHYYKRKKKVLVVCLAGARSVLRAEKKSVFGSCGK
jgi:hypothetical protein